MSENYPRGRDPSYEDWKRARSEQVLTENEVLQEAVRTLDMLMAILMEESQEWDPLYRKQLRDQITQLLLQLGVQGLRDYQGILDLYQRAYGSTKQFAMREEWAEVVQKLNSEE